MVRYTFQLKNYRGWLLGFAKVLNLEATEGKVIIPPRMGKGYILAANINRDISFVVMDFTLRDDLVFFRKKSYFFGLSLFFNQVTVSDFFSIRDAHNAITDKTPNRSNIYLSPTNYDLETTWSRGSHIRRVGIFFSPTYIRRCLKRQILIDLLTYADNRFRNIVQESITFEYRRFLDDIYAVDLQSPIARLVIQNRVLLLTEIFLNSFLIRAPLRKEVRMLKIRRSKERDLEALKDVERILTDNANMTRFPTIDELSRTAMMSTTSLKDKFKQMYGMKVYEFYNRNRLEKAREMLQSGQYTVRQVGKLIGFVNLSNFAKAFRKEFGILPSEVLRGT